MLHRLTEARKKLDRDRRLTHIYLLASTLFSTLVAPWFLGSQLMAWLFGIVTVASLLATFVFVLLPVHIRTQLSLFVNMRILGAVFTIMGVTYGGNFVLIIQAIV